LARIHLPEDLERLLSVVQAALAQKDLMSSSSSPKRMAISFIARR
jgi:hypothetical protein